MERLAPDYQWWLDSYEIFKEEGEPLGFDIRDIRFSGFYSQGDGACWTGYVDVVRWLELNKPDDPNAHILCALIEDEWVVGRLEINQSHSRYEHSHTMNHSGLGVYAPVESEDIEYLFTKGIFAGASVSNLFQAMGAGFVDVVCAEILQDARNYADKIYERLRDEYEHLCSEEVIAETCDANEYLFDEAGNFV